MNGDTDTAVVEPPQEPGFTYMGEKRPMPPRPPPSQFFAQHPGAGYDPTADQVALQQRNATQLPIEEAQKAVEAATKFQAQRGYQKDLQGGMSPTDAMAKWGPVLFSGSKSNAGMGAMMRSSQPVLRNVGGGLYRVPSSGPAQLVVPPRDKGSTWSWQDKEDYTAASRRFSEMSKESATKSLSDPTPMRRQMLSDKAIMDALSKKYSPSTGAVNSPGATPPGNAPALSPASASVPSAIRPPSGAPAAPPQQAAPGKTRVDRAKELRKEHPDWSKDKIIDQVYQEFG